MIICLSVFLLALLFMCVSIQKETAVPIVTYLLVVFGGVAYLEFHTPPEVVNTVVEQSDITDIIARKSKDGERVFYTYSVPCSRFKTKVDFKLTDKSYKAGDIVTVNLGYSNKGRLVDVFVVMSDGLKVEADNKLPVRGLLRDLVW